MAMGSEMHSLVAMVVAGDWWLGALAGKTVIACFAPLTALGLFAAGRRLVGPGAGTIAGFIYISIPWIVHVSTAGLVEGAAACYLFLSAYALLLCFQGNAQHDGRAGGEPGSRGDLGRWKVSPPLVLAGYLAGCAVATKYPAILFVLMPLTLWLLAASLRSLLREGRSARAGRVWAAGLLLPVGSFLVAAAVGCGLWLGKNWVLTGNPTYPLLYGVFDGSTWTPEKDERWNRAHRPHDFSPGALAADFCRVVWRSEWLSPLVMPLAALSLLRWWRQRPAPSGPARSRPERNGRERRLPVGALWAYFAFVLLIWWLFTHRIDRFWIPALPLASLLAAVGACWSSERLWRVVLAGLLILGLVSNFLVASSVRPGVYNRYFVSLERLRDHPERVDPWQRYFNQNCRSGRLLMVGVADVFDLEVPVLYNTVFDDCIFTQIVKGHTADQIHAALAAKGITHVFVHWGEIARYRSPGNYGFSSFVQPGVFDHLVAERVLEQPMPTLDGHPGRAYPVVENRESR
jgi:hypothetical protein